LIEDLSEAFSSFLHMYPSEEKSYWDEARAISARGGKSLVVDFEHLIEFDFELATETISRPYKYIEVLEKSIFEVTGQEMHVRFKNLPEIKMVKEIRSDQIGKLLGVEGIVTRVSEVKPRINLAIFQCRRCGEEIEVLQSGEVMKVPGVCPNPSCGRSGPFDLLEEKSEFEDWQRIRIQDRPERLRGGEIPRFIEAILRDDIVDKVKPGDSVYISGILRTIQERGRKSTKTTFRKYLEVNYIESKSRGVEDFEITPEEEKMILELSRDPLIVRKIRDSIAPGIYGYEEIKESIALQLFGGVARELPDGTRIRGDCNVLLVGDPGVAKSQILQYVSRIAPKGIYTSGRGTSAAGLTAAVIREEDGFSLEAGALVLADGGIACVDEIDKMRDEDRVAIHEAMEQQTISIAKAGIVATLNARTAILAAANPKFGRFDPKETVSDQIDLPPTLISRFDLIWPMEDRPDPKRDEELARHVTEVHMDPEVRVRPPIDPELLRKYIIYARRNAHPRLSKEASERILKFYVEMRNKERDEEGGSVPITVRQLEALIRLAEARARMRLSNEVTAEDAEEVIRLMKECLRRVGVDPETKRFDIDAIMTGRPKTKRERLSRVLEIIKGYYSEKGKEISEKELMELAKEEGIPSSLVREAINVFLKSGDIYEPKPGHYMPLH